jgi:hypothetical protein
VKPTPDAIKKAVGWWASKLVFCKNQGISDEERTNPSSVGYQWAERLMSETKPKVTADQIEAFKSLLTATLEAWHPKAHICLNVDYQPCKALADALNGAGIENAMGVLPIKTAMVIEGDKAEVAYGYGAEYVTL